VSKLDIDTSQFPNAATAREIAEQRKIKLNSVIVSTTPDIEGKAISEYLGVVAGDNIFSPPLLKSAGEKITDIRDKAMREMLEKAVGMGADAIINLRVTYGTYMAQGSAWNVMVITVYGTAVRLSELEA
jgi:uncharacterized protein YbjQ (UPF0145 family)